MEFHLPKVSIKRAEMNLPSNLIGLFAEVSLKQTLESSAVASLVAEIFMGFESKKPCSVSLLAFVE